MDRLYHSLLLRAPQRSPSGLYEACLIRTPVIRFEMRRVRSRPTQRLTLKQHWASDEGKVLLFLVQQMPSVISHRITKELSREKESLDWDRFLNYPDRLAVSPEEASKLKQAAERYFTAAGLSRREQAILKLNVVLECRKEKWERQQKVKYLNMSVKSYEKHLGHARVALRMARWKPIPNGYKRLLDKFFLGGLTKSRLFFLLVV